jgi:hypothetical protein
MKMDTGTQDVNVHGDFETSDFAIGDIAFIVDMFADKVYSHKERAVIRELSCNAHDSHIMAGTTDIPFEVHLPTQLEAYFTIRDYGTGLSDDQIRNIFAGIGISTKRDSNEVIGCFGIGSLSPYSLTDSFTVKSYIDGICRTYTCYRDEQRKPVVALLTELETDEANGLEVSLTVEDRVWEFQREATKVFKFWEGTLPKINDKSVIEECEEQRELYVFKGDDFGLTPSYGSMKAIMGNISYAIPDELDEFDCNGYLKFKLGELNFDTARENLTMDDKTIAAINNKFAEVKNKLATEASQQIEQEPTAFKRAVMADGLRGGSLGKHVKADLTKYELPEASKEFTYFKRSYRSTDKGTTKRVPVGDNIKYYRHKDRMQTRIREYMKDHDRLTIVILSDEQIRECLIDDDVLLDLNDLPKVVRQSYATAGCTVKTFKFDRNHSGWSATDFWNATELTIDGDEIVYVEINRWEPQDGRLVYHGNRDIQRVLGRLENKCGLVAPTVVGLKTAFLKTKQFEKGNFISLEEYVKRELAANTPTTFYKYNKDQYETIRTLDNHIDCPDVTDIIKLAESQSNDEISQWIDSLNRQMDNPYIETEMTEDLYLQECLDDFFKKYEMLTFVSHWEIRNEDNNPKIAKYIGGTVKENTNNDD